MGDFTTQIYLSCPFGTLAYIELFGQQSMDTETKCARHIKAPTDENFLAVDMYPESCDLYDFEYEKQETIHDAFDEFCLEKYECEFPIKREWFQQNQCDDDDLNPADTKVIVIANCKAEEIQI